MLTMFDWPSRFDRGYLFRYLKQGNGSFSICLVEKMFESRASQPQCPGCSSDLGRVAFINNNLAWKLLPTKVFWKRGRQPKHTPPATPASASSATTTTTTTSQPAESPSSSATTTNQ
ncbi:hypothetical protein QOT17_009526 [Balamuthia mandrillaris]